MKQIVPLILTILFSITLPQADEKDKSDCYPITSADLIKPDAPKFSQYPAKPEKITHPAPLNLKSNHIAKLFRTSLRHGLSEGPNFAGHYTVVVWGCGAGCTSFGVVDAKTGNVITPDSFSNTNNVHLNLDTDDFEPTANTEYGCLRFRLDSQLLIVLGTLDEDENREGAFYFIIDKAKLKPIYSVRTKKRFCKDSDW